MSPTILIIALLPAMVVFVVAAATRSQLWTGLTAVIAAGVGALTGNPAYIALDVLAVVAVYWTCVRTLRKRKNASVEGNKVRRMKTAETDQLAGGPLDSARPVMNVSAVQGVEWTAWFGRALKRLAKGALIGGLVGLAWVAYHKVLHPYVWQTPVPPQVASPSAPAPNLTQDQKSREYELALVSVERQYPALNQDSAEYRQDLVDKVVARMRTFVANGTATHLALRMAADEVMFAEAREETAHVAPNTQRQIYRCEAGGRVTYSDAPCRRK